MSRTQPNRPRVHESRTRTEAILAEIAAVRAAIDRLGDRSSLAEIAEMLREQNELRKRIAAKLDESILP